MNFLTYFVSSGKTYLSTMSPKQKVAIEPRAGVKQAKICPKAAKNCKYSYLQCNIIQILLNFQHIFVFSSQRVVIEPIAGMNKTKICPKLVEKCVT